MLIVWEINCAIDKVIKQSISIFNGHVFLTILKFQHNDPHFKKIMVINVSDAEILNFHTNTIIPTFIVISHNRGWFLNFQWFLDFQWFLPKVVKSVRFVFEKLLDVHQMAALFVLLLQLLPCWIGAQFTLGFHFDEVVRAQLTLIKYRWILTVQKNRCRLKVGTFCIFEWSRRPKRCWNYLYRYAIIVLITNVEKV